MIGKSILTWIALAGTASVVLYQTSYRVQEQADELANLNRQIVAEQEAIQVLRAEWAYLNDPARLERLVAQHSLLGQTRVEQIVALDQIPTKPLPGLEPEADQPPLLLSSAPMRKPEFAPGAPRKPTPGPSPAPAGSIVLASYGGAASYGAPQ